MNPTDLLPLLYKIAAYLSDSLSYVQDNKTSKLHADVLSAIQSLTKD